MMFFIKFSNHSINDIENMILVDFIKISDLYYEKYFKKKEK
jgi:hypothetical protein